MILDIVFPQEDRRARTSQVFSERPERQERPERPARPERRAPAARNAGGAPQQAAGTTEAALNVFEQEKLAERFLRAVEAASKRGEEMGREWGGKD
jgi:hypothetical protein